MLMTERRKLARPVSVCGPAPPPGDVGGVKGRREEAELKRTSSLVLRRCSFSSVFFSAFLSFHILDGVTSSHITAESLCTNVA